MPQRRKELKIEGANLWYLVGLITTDGCLSSDGRHIDITSKDYNFMQEITDLVGAKNKIGLKYGFNKQRAFHIQIANKNLYDFLLSIGLTQNKSLSLGEMRVPDQFFIDFLRGVIDGDGSIRQWTHPSNKREQWSLRIYSGSRDFIKWLNNATEQLLKVFGKIHKNAARTYPIINRREGGTFLQTAARSEDAGVVGKALRQGRTTQPQEAKMSSLPARDCRIGSNTWVLKYGKMAARRIAKQCYYKDCFGLDRKIELAQDCVNSYRGWNKSKTVFI